MPVISDNRLAVLPVSAAQAIFFPIAFPRVTIVWTVKVLPVPSPPVLLKRNQFGEIG